MKIEAAMRLKVMAGFNPRKFCGDLCDAADDEAGEYDKTGVDFYGTPAQLNPLLKAMGYKGSGSSYKHKDGTTITVKALKGGGIGNDKTTRIEAA